MHKALHDFIVISNTSMCFESVEKHTHHVMLIYIVSYVIIWMYMYSYSKPISCLTLMREWVEDNTFEHTIMLCCIYNILMNIASLGHCICFTYISCMSVIHRHSHMGTSCIVTWLNISIAKCYNRSYRPVWTHMHNCVWHHSLTFTTCGIGHACIDCMGCKHDTIVWSTVHNL
jgi:hypothetical protein